MKTFDAILIRAAASVGAPGEAKWSMLFPKGTFHRGDLPGGVATIDDAYCATLVENWKKRGEPELPIDYFHRGGSGVQVPNDQKIASGWMSKIEARADGVWALVKWTAKAREMILADELRHLSPEWHPNDVDVKTGKRQGPTLWGAGLLNDPLFKEMPRVAASTGTVPADAVPPAQTLTTEHSMKLILEAALAALSLKPDATEERILARAKELKETDAKLTALTTERDDAVRASTNVEPLRATVTALSSKVDALTAANVALEASAKKTAVDGLIASLMNDGKGNVRITAAQADSVRVYASAVGVEEAKKFYAGFPVIQKLGELGHAGDAGDESPQTAFTKLQAAAADLVKAGTKPSDALIRAMELNPELTKASAALKSPVRS